MSTGRKSGNSKLYGRPLNENGAIDLVKVRAADPTFVLEEISPISLRSVLKSPYYDAVHKQLARELLTHIESGAPAAGSTEREQDEARVDAMLKAALAGTDTDVAKEKL